MFLILLLVATVVSAAIYWRTASDIVALLGVGMAICCLIWGLVVVHWSIHILALLGVLLLGRPLTSAVSNSRYR